MDGTHDGHDDGHDPAGELLHEIEPVTVTDSDGQPLGQAPATVGQQLGEPLVESDPRLPLQDLTSHPLVEPGGGAVVELDAPGGSAGTGSDSRELHGEHHGGAWRSIRTISAVGCGSA